jgi:hypothetical protein
MADEKKEIFGRQIFFLFVPPEEGRKIAKEIVSNEYEAYPVSDEPKLNPDFLLECPGAVVFVYENNFPHHFKWPYHYEKLVACGEEGKIMISTWYREERTLRVRNDFSNFTVPIAEISLEEGSRAIVRHILELLSALDARGRRKHIRVRCDDGYSATFSVKIQKQIYSGSIIDISSIGMACVFSDQIELAPKKYLDNIQLRLNGQLCQLSGTIFGKREINGSLVYVIVFSYQEMPDVRNKISDYIYVALQRELKKKKISSD